MERNNESNLYEHLDDPIIGQIHKAYQELEAKMSSSPSKNVELSREFERVKALWDTVQEQIKKGSAAEQVGIDLPGLLRDMDKLNENYG